jgi:tetratricopeptide (TPR) repeat protein
MGGPGAAAGAPDEALPAADPREARDVAAFQAAEPTVRGGLFTWRNAIFGGMAAFALLGALTVAYLFMRTAGIGPAATLVAQGVIEEGAEVILADFESAEAEHADIVESLLRIDLLESPTIDVVERSELADALGRMELDAEAPITADVAREIAAREGYPAVIQGEVRTAGGGFVLTASIVGGEAWRSLAGFRATARTEDDLIPAIESLSRDIRDKSGESLRSVQRAPALSTVTTASLEALRLYSRADDTERGGDLVGAVELYERAIEADPDFAMAHRKLGVALGNLGIRVDDRLAAFTRAYELLDRLPDTERYLAESYYHRAVTGETPRVIQANERVLEIDPEHNIALNNLAVVLRELGRREEAQRLFEQSLENEVRLQSVQNLARVRFETGDQQGGMDVLDLGIERLPTAAWVFDDMRIQQFLDVGEYDVADDYSAGYAEQHRGARASAAHARQRYVLAAVRGRLADAENATAGMEGDPSISGHPVSIARSRAALEAARGDTAAAVARLLDTHEAVRSEYSPSQSLVPITVSWLLAWGATDEAARINAEWESEVDEATLGQAGRDARARLGALFLIFEGSPAEAIPILEGLERSCPGTCARASAHDLAIAHDRMGDVENAISHYERYLSDPQAARGMNDAWYLADTLERLGELHAAQGDDAAAARYYSRFAELWDGADDVLQPRVQAARARVVELGGGTS